MNNLKFRVWDKKLKLLRNVSYIDFDNKKIIYHNGFVNYYANFEDVEIMQLTGLKDENEVEIYDGDILKIIYVPLAYLPEELSVDIGVVVFKNYGFYVKIDDTFVSLKKIEEMADVEIIGNIYENRKLAKIKTNII